MPIAKTRTMYYLVMRLMQSHLNVGSYMLTTIIHRQLFSLNCMNRTLGPVEQPATGTVFC